MARLPASLPCALQFALRWGGVCGFQTPEQMFTPQGIAVDAAGNLLVADSGNHRILRWSPNGTLLAVFGAAGEGNGEAAAPEQSSM